MPCLKRPHFHYPQAATEEARNNQIASALILFARTRDVWPWRLGAQIQKPFGPGQERPILLDGGERWGWDFSRAESTA